MWHWKVRRGNDREFNEVNDMEVTKSKYPFLHEGKIDKCIYPACRLVFDAVIAAKIPYGRTDEVLHLVKDALDRLKVGETEFTD